MGGQSLCAQYTDFYRIILSRNLTISMVLCSSPPSTLNLIVQRNLIDSEIEHFQGLLLFLGSMHLSPSIADSRGWCLSSTGLFTVKYFLLALSLPPTPLLFYPTKFLCCSKAPSKVKAFSWLVVHRNDLIDPLNPKWCILCKGEGEIIDHLFLHCPFACGLWNKLFNLARIVWVSSRRDLKRSCGIYFTFTHLCGLIVPKPLVGFLFRFYFLAMVCIS